MLSLYQVLTKCDPLVYGLPFWSLKFGMMRVTILVSGNQSMRNTDKSMELLDTMTWAVLNCDQLQTKLVQ